MSVGYEQGEQAGVAGANMTHVEQVPSSNLSRGTGCCG